MGVSPRAVKKWVADFRRRGEAGLAPKKATEKPHSGVDDRWVETLGQPAEPDGPEEEALVDAPETGDDDEADLEDLGDDDFYADALEDV
ncbi:hypothetical protein [Streptomyces sp. 3214.6]|uniref:hypothetical protein n=1 Tax=Streptomyces sp. 3214.6 TaxID=1882757 RepID=UPI003FA7EC29